MGRGRIRHLVRLEEDPTTSRPRAQSTVPTSLVRGVSVARYLLVDELGRGGMGVVFKAYDPDLDRPVALKLIAGQGNSEIAHDRLLREAQALARLQHPNVIAVYDVGPFGRDVFIAMEFVQGKTLRQWLKDDPRSQREVLDAFLAAGEGPQAHIEPGSFTATSKP